MDGHSPQSAPTTDLLVAAAGVQKEGVYRPEYECDRIVCATPGSFLGMGVSSFSNSGCTSGRLLGCGVIHSCIQQSSDIDTAA